MLRGILKGPWFILPPQSLCFVFHGTYLFMLIRSSRLTGLLLLTWSPKGRDF